MPVAGREDAQILEPIDDARDALRSEYDSERIWLIAFVDAYETPRELVLGVGVLALSELEQTRLLIVGRSYCGQALFVRINFDL